MNKSSTTAPGSLRLLGVLLLYLVVGIYVVISRAELTVDLGYFLPEPETLAQELMTSRLGQGPGSRLMFISLDADVDQQVLGRLSDDLRATGLFSRVADGLTNTGGSALPDVVWRNRFLLADVSLETADLHAALLERQADMALLGDAGMLSYLAADPQLVSLAFIEQLAEPGERTAVAPLPGVHLLAETIAPAFDANAQQLVVAAVQQLVLQHTGMLPELHGAGVYSAELQQTVRTDAQFRSFAATAVIIIVLLLLYRNWLVVPLSLLPVAVGGVTGALGLTLVYGQIHGITFAFGFTLLGVAIDYPLHLLSHARSNDARQSMRLIWPTLRLGALTTIVAYAALAFGGSRGLAQLGLFSVAGVAAALVTARWALPDLVTRFGFTRPSQNPVPHRPAARKLRHVFWLVGLMIAITALVSLRPALWESNLSALVPVDAKRLQRDGQLRVAMGAPDIGYFLAVTGASREAVLQQTEALEPVLLQAQAAGIISGYALITQLLPSEQRQQVRLANIGNVTDLSARVQRAAEGTAFRPAAFAPFVAEIERLRADPEMLTEQSWQGSVFAELVEFGVIADADYWVTQSLLYGLQEPANLQALLGSAGAATVIDLKGASMALVESYRQRVLRVLLISCSLAFVLLWWRLASVTRLFWVTGSLLTALLLTVAIKALLLGGFSLFGLMACVLVTGLGLDYGLFCSRDEADSAAELDSAHAVNACACSTLAAFTILAFSPIPVLQEIGLTVALGVGITYLLMVLGQRRVAPV